MSSDRTCKVDIHRGVVDDSKVNRNLAVTAADVEESINESKQLGSAKEVEGQFDYKRDNLVRPPISLEDLVRLYRTNYAHNYCVNTKASCISGVGWHLVSRLDQVHDFNDQEMKAEIDRLEKQQKNVGKPEDQQDNAADTKPAPVEKPPVVVVQPPPPPPVPKVKPLTPEETAKLAEYKVIYEKHMADKKRLIKFFGEINPDEPFATVNEHSDIDRESEGFCCWELVRNIKGEIARVFHMPSVTVRMMSNNLGVCQIKAPSLYDFHGMGVPQDQYGSKKVFFKHIGLPIIMDSRNGRVAGLYNVKRDGSLSKSITWYDEKEGKPGGPVLDRQYWANEVLVHRRYSPDNFWYGLPAIIAGLDACVGDRSAANYQEQFFDNNAVPRFAVIFTGVSLDEKAKSDFDHFFDYDIRNNAHCTMRLELPGGETDPSTNVRTEPAGVKFERLAMEVTDASFRNYRQDNRGQIHVAHRVPLALSPWSEMSSTNDTLLVDLEIFKSQVIRPIQQEREFLINKHLIKDNFGIDTWEFEFNEIDNIDELKQQQINCGYVNNTIMTINEVRGKLGLPPKKGGDVAFKITPLGLVKLDDIEELDTGDLAARPNAPLAGPDQGQPAGGRPAKPIDQPKKPAGQSDEEQKKTEGRFITYDELREIGRKAREDKKKNLVDIIDQLIGGSGTP